MVAKGQRQSSRQSSRRQGGPRGAMPVERPHPFLCGSMEELTPDILSGDPEAYLARLMVGNPVKVGELFPGFLSTQMLSLQKTLTRLSNIEANSEWLDLTESNSLRTGIDRQGQEADAAVEEMDQSMMVLLPKTPAKKRTEEQEKEKELQEKKRAELKEEDEKKRNLEEKIRLEKAREQKLQEEDEKKKALEEKMRQERERKLQEEEELERKRHEELERRRLDLEELERKKIKEEEKRRLEAEELKRKELQERQRLADEAVKAEEERKLLAAQQSQKDASPSDEKPTKKPSRPQTPQSMSMSAPRVPLGAIKRTLSQRTASTEKMGHRVPITLSGTNLHRSVEKHCKTKTAVAPTLVGANRLSSNSSSAEKRKLAGESGGILSSLYSFLPTRSKEKQPTQEEIRKEREEKMREKQQQVEDQLREQEEAKKRMLEEKRIQREEKAKRAEESRKQQEELAKVKAMQKQESKMASMQNYKEIQTKKMEECRKKKEALDEKKHLEEEERRRKEAILREREEQMRLKANALAKAVEEKKVDLNTTYEVPDDPPEPKVKKPGPLSKTAAAANRGTYNATEPPTKTQKEPPACESYDITPARHELPPEPLTNPDNYDITDLNSDEETDDEDEPRKQVPPWAEGHAFRLLLMSQSYSPPDVDLIFDMIDMPDLTKIFTLQKKRFHKRTSSAQWGKMPASYKF